MDITNPNEAVRRMNSGAWIATEKPAQIPSWSEENGIIRFTVTSDGTTPLGWVKRFMRRGFPLRFSERMLHLSKFTPTSGVTTEIAVLKGTLFEKGDLITRNIRARALELNLKKPGMEEACLICEKYSNKEIRSMGLDWLIVMHGLKRDTYDEPCCMGRFCDNDIHDIDAVEASRKRKWNHNNGFAFIVPKS